MIFAKSGTMYGTTHSVREADKFIFITTINQTVPIAKHPMSPNIIDTTVITIFVISLFPFASFIINPMINAVSKNPTIYHPVGPAITPGPEENPANTGTPIVPSIINTIIEISLLFVPRSPAVTNTAKVCSVNGTGPIGTLIHEHTAIIAVNTAINTIFCTDKTDLLLIFCIL